MGVYYPKKKNASEKLKKLSTTPILIATLILAAAVEGGRRRAICTPHVRWCEASAERLMGRNQFGEELVQRGHSPAKRGGVRGWNGVELKPDFAVNTG
jgi:hypothetical protein